MNHIIRNLNQALAFQLEGVYEIVKTLQSDLPKVAKLVTDQEMRMVFNAYRQNLGDQRLKLKRIFGYVLNGPYGRKTSHVANAIAQWDDVSEMDILPGVRDVLLGTSLELSIKHMIDAYTNARYIAMRLELDMVVHILDDLVDSEEEFAQNLKRLSSTQVNQACLLTVN